VIGAEVQPDIDPHLQLRPRSDCTSRLDCDLSALSLPEFRAGLAVSVVLLLVGAGLILARRRTAEPSPVLGVLLLVGAAIGYQVTGHLLPWWACSIGLVALGGVVTDSRDLGLAWRVAAAAPGATLLAATPALRPLVPWWCLVVLGVATAVGAALASEMDRRHRRNGLAPVCLAVSVCGVYETVPDTDLVLVLLPLVLLLALLSWPWPLARLGSVGCYGGVGAVLFAVVVGGRGRLSAVVGGVACLGLLALEPLARRLARGTSVLDSLPRAPTTAVLVGAAQLLVVLVATRIAGTRSSVAMAVLVSAVSMTTFLVILVVLNVRTRPRREVTA
jgi:hypothetical protein